MRTVDLTGELPAALADLPSAAAELALQFASASDPLVWRTPERTLIGFGAALRLELTGQNRTEEARAALQRLGELATGSAEELRAFGSFTFSAASTKASVLLVPAGILHIEGGRVRLTTITAPGSAPAQLPPPAPLAPEWQPTHWHTAASEQQVAEFLEAAEAALNHIRGEKLQKVVLARRVSGELPASADLRVPLLRLAREYGDCQVFAVDGLLGASPETLVTAAHGRVCSRVLAGTRGRKPHTAARDTAERDELMRDPKELREHELAVRSVVDSLSPHASDLTVQGPAALRLPNVWHLASDISARVAPGTHVLSVVRALHPTAAVAGTPTAAALSLISELEGFDRGHYAGAVGWASAAGEGEWAVALRCAAVDEAAGGARQLTAWAGCGIVEGSQPQHELRETAAKLAPVRGAFG